ncbi:hypothetical protein GOEFS_001_00010 [Gordonia effusa NBRC 100432]|uniref:Uncharacterized protein n=1 Tax=Gordonia effusa NBRC 100432 TaxID=1077974 RepID=H0QUF5_9ACTN|nr:hypothetical protein [Gordonia effusa]GAB16456.1 hypothetical protein GOEFS_001_00010 [Gordonia effusa NBRC 100432]
MSTSHVVHHRESHGNHPMSVVGYVLVLAGFASAALWLVHLASGNTSLAITFGVLTGAAFVSAVVILTTLSRKVHHSPLIPDNTDVETTRYLTEYRG